MAHGHDHDGHDHEHDHAHGGHSHARGHGHHHHHHAPADFGRAFAIGIALNGAYVIGEAVYGIFANSLSLLADAGHNAGDVVSLAMAWLAAWLSRRANPDVRPDPHSIPANPTWRSSPDTKTGARSVCPRIIPALLSI